MKKAATIRKNSRQVHRKRFCIIFIEIFVAVIFLLFFLFVCSLRLLEDNFISSDVNIIETDKFKDDYRDEMRENETKTFDTAPFNEPNHYVPEQRSLANLLMTAKQPIGSTMYVWGGGWDESDTAAGVDAKRIGMSPRWKKFADLQNSSYDYRETRYKIHEGLDCSGYIGWVVYNVFETEDGREGYVVKSTDMAENFAKRGFGSYKSASQVKDWKAGDIMSMPGHVWMAVGMCSDSSVVLMNASPPGVVLKGTLAADGSRTIAVELAEKYMKRYYASWYEKFPNCSASYSYLTNSSQMRWNREVLSDKEEFSKKSAEEILMNLYEQQ